MTDFSVRGLLRSPDGTTSVPVTIDFSSSGIDVRVAGYGVAETENGQGPVLFLEFYRNRLRLHVWPDHDDSDPRTIDLEEAREPNNSPLPDYGTRDEHPQHVRDCWRQEVVAGDTNLGYWEWIKHRLAAE